MHDVPYVQPDHIGPEITASMTAVSSALRQEYPDVPLGVQVLSAANKQALAVALAAGRIRSWEKTSTVVLSLILFILLEQTLLLLM